MIRRAKKRSHEVANLSIHDARHTQKADHDISDVKQNVLGTKQKGKGPSEELLEKLVFGNVDGSDSESESESESEREEVELEECENDKADSDSDGEEALEGASTQLQERLGYGVLDKEKRKPAWQDETDEQGLSFGQERSNRQDKLKRRNEQEVSGRQLQQRLKTQYEKVVGSTPSWAKLKSEREEEGDDSDSDDEDDDNPLLRHTGNYLTCSEQLPKNSLNMRRVTNLNKEQPTMGKVSSVEFHPSAQVAMVAGLDQRLNLFQVEGRHNPKIQSVFLDQFPVYSAHFSANGMEVIVGGRRKFFYVYDMIAGKVTQVPYIRGIQEKKLIQFEVSPDGRFLAFLGEYGNVHLLSAQTKELVTTMKMNGSADAVTFTHDGSKMLSLGDDGDVYVWDMNTRDCVHKFADEGCIKGNTISVSSGSQYVATGSQCGVVNIYDDQCFTKSCPTPLRALMNLTTPVTATRFNPTNEILAAVSVFSKDVAKMVHLPSCHTFPNFPSFNEKFHAPSAVDFSPRSGYFALGNNKGAVLLFRLKHYTEY